MKQFRIRNSELKEMIKKAEEIYNRYRSPEARVEILEIEDDKIVALFSGSFCETCGINDWIDDFRYVLREKGLEVVIERIDEVDEWSRIAYFRIIKN